MTPPAYLLPQLSDESITLDYRVENIVRIEKRIILLEKNLLSNNDVEVKELKRIHFIELFRSYLMTMVDVEENHGRVRRNEKISRWSISVRTGHSIAEWIMDSYCACDSNVFLSNASNFRNNFDDHLDIIRYYNKIVPTLNKIRKDRRNMSPFELIDESYIFKYLKEVSYIANRNLFVFAHTIKDVLHGDTIIYDDNICSMIENIPLITNGVVCTRTIDERMNYTTSLRRMKGKCSPSDITKLMDAITIEESRIWAMTFFIDGVNIIMPENVNINVPDGDFLTILEDYVSYDMDRNLYTDVVDLIRFFNMKVPKFKDDFTEITPDILKKEFPDEYMNNPDIFDYLTNQVRLDTIENIINS